MLRAGEVPLSRRYGPLDEERLPAKRLLDRQPVNVGHGLLAGRLAPRRRLSDVRHDAGREGVGFGNQTTNDMPARDQNEGEGQQCAGETLQLTAPFCHSACG